MIAFLAGLLVIAVIVIGVTFGNNDKLEIENKEMKNKISELKRTLKFREYSFISYKGYPLKVIKVGNIFNDGTTIKGIPVMLEVRTNTEGGRMLYKTIYPSGFNSYLFPAQTDYDYSGDTVGSGDGTWTSASSSSSVYTVENPGIDGAYGQNVTGIFFFTTDGKYIEWTGDFLYSDIPFEVDKPVLNYKEGK